MREAVVVASSRTPLAKSHRGSFNMTRPDDLAAHATRDDVETPWFVFVLRESIRRKKLIGRRLRRAHESGRLLARDLEITRRRATGHHRRERRGASADHARCVAQLVFRRAGVSMRERGAERRT